MGTVTQLDDNSHDLVATDTVTYYSVSAGAVDLANATTGSNVLVLGDSLSTALDVALEASGAYALTTNAANDGLVKEDGILVLWSDGTDSYLSVAEQSVANRDDATIVANDLTIHDIAVFKGITDADNIVAGNFDAIL